MEFTVPSRRGLLIGAAMVALYGRRQEALLAARHHGLEDWKKHPVYAECDRLIEALRTGQTVTTSFEDLIDLMAHTRQMMRISLEEWEQSVPLVLAEQPRWTPG